MSNGIILSNLLKEIKILTKENKETNFCFLENLDKIIDLYLKGDNQENIIEHLKIFNENLKKQTITNEQKINIKQTNLNDKNIKDFLEKIELLLQNNELELITNISNLLKTYNEDSKKQSIIIESLIIFNNTLENINNNTKITPKNK